MYFMGCFPFGSGPSHPEPHYWGKCIDSSELERERSSLDPPTPILFLTNLYFPTVPQSCGTPTLHLNAFLQKPAMHELD